ncbi:MAG: N-acyl-D-glutamate deacylase [Clostridiales bacterium]|nr:N-acyl-D-glutamate deacylase [Clostridiales bacterium]
MLDILIKNGLIVDGTGKPGYNGDIGIKDERIVQIDRNISSEAVEVIDAQGLTVVPGFIDVHSHNDLVPFMEDKLKGLKLMQGVTTELVGQCGLGVVPCVESKNGIWKSYVRGVVGDPEQDWKFRNMDDYIEQISSLGLKNNYSALVSHGAIKASVMGFEDGAPSEEQINRMCQIADDAMNAGAFGMSLGLQYMPGVFSRKKELTAICNIIARHNGIIMIHLRDHDKRILNALDEIVEVAKVTGVKLHISHLKSYNSEELGCPAETLIDYVEKTIYKGINITFDEHLYLSGSTLMTQLLPPFVTSLGTNSIADNLKNKQILERIKDELITESISYDGWDNYTAVIGWDGVLITSVNKDENKKYVGRTVGEISREIGVHPVDFVAELLVSEEGGVGIITLNVFSEEDNTKLIQHPRCMIGSDSIPAGVPHPRFFCNFPLYISKYVREKKVLSLENAVHKATQLPAKVIGYKDIGELANGKTADITIFDFNEITGYEDYRNPTKKPLGIKYVILNGKLAVSNGSLCKEYNGKALKYIPENGTAK